MKHTKYGWIEEEQRLVGLPLTFIAILLFLGLVLHTLAPSVSQTKEETQQTYAVKPACNNTTCWIVHYSRQYNFDKQVATRIAMCESSLDPYARNPNSTASGIYQITRATFLEGAYRRGLDWTWNEVMDIHKNIDMAIWYMSMGEISRWDASRHCWDSKY